MQSSTCSTLTYQMPVSQAVLMSFQVSQTLKAVESRVRGSGEGLEGRPGVSAGVHDELLSEPAMCEQFVGLLCQFEPSAVLPFLQSHDSYR